LITYKETDIIKFVLIKTSRKRTVVQIVAIQQARTVHRALKIHELVLYDVQVKPPLKYALSNRFASI